MDKEIYFHHFHTQWKTEYGKAVYIVGSIPDLGEWKLELARRLTCYGNENWVISVPIPLNKKIQFKYFISDFEINLKNLQWQPQENNHKLKVKDIQGKKKQPLKFMSFNLRYENKNDINEYSWTNRKKNCVELINHYKPDFIGVQEAVRAQRQYLAQELKNQYFYLGKARDNKKGQQCGIFIKQNQFILLQYGFQWISQSRQEGSVGFDAKLPRYYTYAVLLDRYSLGNLIMVVNVHLDHVGALAQKKGVEYMCDTCLKFKQKYKKDPNYQIEGFLIVGDFNAAQKSETTVGFHEGPINFSSVRQIAKKSNKSLTFNGFKNKYLVKIGQFLINDKLTIDHMFLHHNPQALSVDEFQVLKLGEKIVSDHFPIMCSLKRQMIS